MKSLGLLCSQFFIVYVYLIVQVQNTHCSGFEQDDIDWNNFSPIVDLPDIDEHDDSGQRSQNVETLSSSPQQSQLRSQNLETPSSLPQPTRPSPVYSFHGDKDWNQDIMEKKFIEEVEYWEDVRANLRNKIKLTEICTSFSWEYKEIKYPKICSQRYSHAMNFYKSKKTTPIIVKSINETILMSRVMLACHCYNQKNEYESWFNEHHFAVAKHSNDAYFLFKYESINDLYLYGFVKNFTY